MCILLGAREKIWTRQIGEIRHYFFWSNGTSCLITSNTTVSVLRDKIVCSFSTTTPPMSPRPRQQVNDDSDGNGTESARCFVFCPVIDTAGVQMGEKKNLPILAKRKILRSRSQVKWFHRRPTRNHNKAFKQTASYGLRLAKQRMQRRQVKLGSSQRCTILRQHTR